MAAKQGPTPAEVLDMLDVAKIRGTNMERIHHLKRVRYFMEQAGQDTSVLRREIVRLKLLNIQFTNELQDFRNHPWFKDSGYPFQWE